MSALTNITIEELISSFDSRGFELTTDRRVLVDISIEETIVSVLINRQERLIEGIPILLTKNKVDYKKLKELIDKYKVWNAFGYLGNFTLRHVHDNELKKLVRYCRGRVKKNTNLSTLDEAFFKYSKTKRQEEWNVIGAPSYFSLEQQYRRYCR